jgi:hypothetical protein
MNIMFAQAILQKESMRCGFVTGHDFREPLIKPAFLRTESDHGNSPAGFLSVVEKRR